MTDFSDDDDYDPIYVHYTHELKIVRIIEDVIVPTKLSLKAEVLTDEDASPDALSLAFSKIKFWFDSIVSRSIMFNRYNGVAIGMLLDENGHNRSGNVLMIMPDEPTEDLLAMIFQAKMTALAAGAVEFGLVEIRADNETGLGYTYCGDHALDLPPMEAWMPEPNWFKDPWWSRDDASTLDVIPPDGADLDQKPDWAFSLDFLGAIGQPTSMAGSSVTRAEFKPTVIDGGKK